MKHIRPVLAAKLKSEKPTSEEAAPWSEKARRLFEHWDALGSERKGSCPALGVSRCMVPPYGDKLSYHGQ